MSNFVPQLGSDGRIIEGIITTMHEDGSVNISPLGPIVDNGFQNFLLRPFNTSNTYQNLKRTKQAVFHVTDDVKLIAQSAIGTPNPLPDLIPAQAIDGYILAQACRWYALEILSIDDTTERTEIQAKTIAQGRIRDFLGYNRAQHAVLEAAILATRIGILPADEILMDLRRLNIPVTKTASSEELEAFQFLADYIEASLEPSRVSTS